MSKSVYWPHGAVRRITPNIGGRHVIAGGLRGSMPPYPPLAITFSGPNIADFSVTRSVAMTPQDLKPKFNNETNFTQWFIRNTWPAGINVLNGVISGTCGAGVTPGAYPSLFVTGKNGSGVAGSSNFFVITVL